MIISFSSVLNEHLGFQQDCKNLPIQQLISQLSIERFIVAILQSDLPPPKKTDPKVEIPT
jgi:hypothetical protein